MKMLYCLGIEIEIVVIEESYFRRSQESSQITVLSAVQTKRMIGFMFADAFTLTVHPSGNTQKMRYIYL